jgi:hypothetical protein
VVAEVATAVLPTCQSVGSRILAGPSVAEDPRHRDGPLRAATVREMGSAHRPSSNQEPGVPPDGVPIELRRGLIYQTPRMSR